MTRATSNLLVSLATTAALASVISASAAADVVNCSGGVTRRAWERSEAGANIDGRRKLRSVRQMNREESRVFVS